MKENNSTTLPCALVVDDDVLIAIQAGNFLEDMGYRAVIVHSAEAAIEQLNQSDGDFQMIFSDIVMPGGMNGLELTLEVRRRYPEIPILLTTGHSPTGRLALDHFPVLSKPYDASSLSRALSGLSRAQ